MAGHILQEYACIFELHRVMTRQEDVLDSFHRTG